MPSKAITPTDQVIGTGDGVRTAFPVVKAYASGGESYLRPIRKLVSGTVVAAIEGEDRREGVDFEVDTAGGQILFDVPPDIGVAVSAGFEFDVPVRFDTDRIQTSVASFQAGDALSVPVVEVRL